MPREGEVMETGQPIKIVVIDDDPTGSQTVHGCLLLTRWDPDTLAEGLRDDFIVLVGGALVS